MNDAAAAAAAAAASGDAAAQAAAAAAAQAAANAAWHAGLDTELVGHAQNRGWDKLDAKAAAQAALKAHREAEKHIGVPVDKLIRIPRDAADAEGWKDYNTKVGVPADGKYDFSTVKFKDGSALSEPVTKFLNDALTRAHVAKVDAPTVASALVKYLDESDTAAAAETAQKLALEKDSLRANWGNHYNANMLIAQGGARVLGVTPEEVAALENIVGYARTMEMFRNVGARSGEDHFISAPTGSGREGPMTKEQAVATLKEKQNDATWRDNLLRGDATALREFHNLTSMINME